MLGGFALGGEQGGRKWEDLGRPAAKWGFCDGPGGVTQARCVSRCQEKLAWKFCISPRGRGFQTIPRRVLFFLSSPLLALSSCLSSSGCQLFPTPPCSRRARCRGSSCPAGPFIWEQGHGPISGHGDTAPHPDLPPGAAEPGAPFGEAPEHPPGAGWMLPERCAAANKQPGRRWRASRQPLPSLAWDGSVSERQDNGDAPAKFGAGGGEEVLQRSKHAGAQGGDAKAVPAATCRV